MSKNKLVKNPLDWIFPTRKDDYADSTVLGLTGPKRSGKSLIMAKILFNALLAGRNVWSTMPVKTPKFYLDKGCPILETKPVDWDAFFSMTEEYQNGLIGIDEASAFNSNRGALTTRNRVTNAFTNQIGHRNLDVVWTAKSAGWLDRQGLGFETDIEIECHDLAKSRWGRLNHIKKGTLISLIAWDRSGAFTGRVADPRDRFARPFKRWLHPDANIYWDAYNTRGLLGVDDIFGGVKLDLQKRVISNKTRLNDDLLESVQDLAGRLRDDSDNGLVSCDIVRDTAGYLGLGLNDKLLGQALRQIGAKHVQKRGGNCYDLGGIKT